MRIKWSIFWIVGAANFIAAFAVNSVNLALPVLAKEFGITQDAASWLPLAYSLIPCCTLLLCGRLGDIFGFKKQFLAGFVIFGIASLGMSCSDSFVTLMIFRCVQGIGYAVLGSLAQAIIKRTFPKNECGKAIGINSVFVSIGLAAGPTVGGILMDAFSWHAIFTVCIPFAIIGFIATLLILPKDIKKEHYAKIDWAGSLLFALFTACFILGLSFSNKWGWSSPRFTLCIVLAAVFLALFIRTEFKNDAPMLPLKLFRNRQFTLSNSVSLCSYFTQQVTLVLLPFFLINSLELKPHNAGLIMLASPLLMMITSAPGGAMSDRVGAKKAATFGLILICLSNIVICITNIEFGLLASFVALALTGCGNGFSVAAINSTILCSVPQENAGTASGMVATIRTFGQSLGIAVGIAIVTMRNTVYTAVCDPNAYIHAQRDAFAVALVVTIMAIISVRKLD